MLDLLERAHESLGEAYAARSSSERHLAAGLAALRAAAALALVARPAMRIARPSEVWRYAALVAPELGEPAAHLALVTSGREEVAAGRTPVTVRAADDLLRAAERFVDLAAAHLGVPVHSVRGLGGGPTRQLGTPLGLAPARPA